MHASSHDAPEIQQIICHEQIQISMYCIGMDDTIEKW